MKLGMNMIREYADIPVSPKDYESKMIMSGTAVEGVEDVADGMDKVVVGRVLTCEDVEGTHLHQCTVDVGGEEPLHIVCGAPNVKVGVLVPVALDGSHLPGGVKIKKGKLRGMVSEGMLCSATELKVPQELYPSVGDAGLLIFNEEYAVGSDVRPILGIDDYAVDFEILANRPDCLCALGIARETAAALDTTFQAPKTDVTEAGGDIHDEVKVRVEAPDLCPRYAARVIKNVRIAPSPLWLRKYLHAAGLRSINNIVDLDLFGQVNAESAGIKHISGTGGQLDFVMGAYLSKGGKSFICLSSAMKGKDGQLKSRIVPTLTNGSICTDPRSTVQYLVTEYGMINLKGLNTWQRAEQIISIAHPQFRDELIKDAEKMGIWRKSNKR